MQKKAINLLIKNKEFIYVTFIVHIYLLYIFM